jgi:hypothetical protein
MDGRYVPTWRMPARPGRRMPRHAIGILSLAAVLLLYFPALSPQGLNVPISFQIAAKQWHALTLVAALGLIAVMFCYRLFASGNWGGGLVLAADLVFLGLISGTDPKSADHLFVYLCAAAVTIAWLYWVAIFEEDNKLEWLSYGAMAGVLVSFMLMGIGERILLTCLLAGINLLYYGYFTHE